MSGSFFSHFCQFTDLCVRGLPLVVVMQLFIKAKDKRQDWTERRVQQFWLVRLTIANAISLDIVTHNGEVREWLHCMLSQLCCTIPEFTVGLIFSLPYLWMFALVLCTNETADLPTQCLIYKVCWALLSLRSPGFIIVQCMLISTVFPT